MVLPKEKPDIMGPNRNSNYTSRTDNGDGSNSRFVLPPLAPPRLDVPSQWAENMFQARHHPFDGPPLLTPIRATLPAPTGTNELGENIPRSQYLRSTLDLNNELGGNIPRPHYPIHRYYGGYSSSRAYSLSQKTHTDGEVENIADQFARSTKSLIDTINPDLFSRSLFNQHTPIERTSPTPMQWKSRRLPFRTDPNPNFTGYNSDLSERRGTWNALLGAAYALGQSQSPRRYPISIPPAVFLKSSQGTDGISCPTSIEPENIFPKRVAPVDAKAARAHRLDVRRKAKALKRKRYGTEDQSTCADSEKTLSVSPKTPRTIAKSVKSLKIYRRRLANRASVQKCRGKQKNRLEDLHKERDVLWDENKILQALKKEIDESGILTLNIPNNLVKLGTELEEYGINICEGSSHVGGSSSLPTPAPGHAYHSNTINGNEIQSMVRSAERNLQVQGNKNDARLSRRQRRAGVRSEEFGNEIAVHESVGKEGRSTTPEDPLSVSNSEGQNSAGIGTGSDDSLKIDSGCVEGREEERSSAIIQGNDHHDPPYSQLSGTGLRSKPIHELRRDR